MKKCEGSWRETVVNEQGKSEQLRHLSQPDASTLAIPILFILDIMTQ